jgi:hypothetical protein
MLAGSLQGEFIPKSPKTEQTAFRDVTEITIVSKLFPGERITQVNLDKRNLNGEQCVTQRNAGVREATRVQDDKFDSVDLSLLHPVNEFMFGIALKTLERVSELFSEVAGASFDIGQSRGAVDVRFA